jgi:hypothetical protein
VVDSHSFPGIAHCAMNESLAAILSFIFALRRGLTGRFAAA